MIVRKWVVTMKIETTDIEVQDYVKKLVNVVAKTMVDSFENLTIEDVNMFKLGYNKAIDDCIEELKKRRDTCYMKVNCDDVELKMLAEKLKGAKQNEDFK